MTEPKLYEGSIGKALYKLFEPNHVCFEQVKDGSSWGRNKFLKMDFVAIKKTWSPTTIKICEIKLSRGDFLKDSKWVNYFDLCNQFYWVCPTGLIKKDEIDPRCGLIYVNPSTLAAKVMKAAIFQKNEPDPHMLLYIMLWQFDSIQSQTDPVSAKLEKYKKDMAKKESFGRLYSGFHSETLNKASKRVYTAERRAEVAEKKYMEVLSCSKLLSDFTSANPHMSKDYLKRLLVQAVEYSNLSRIVGDMVSLRDRLTALIDVIPDKEGE